MMPWQQQARSFRRSPRIDVAATLLTWSVSALALIGAANAMAQTRDRVVATVDVAQRATLAQPQPRWASVQNDRGSVADNAVLDHLTVVLRRSPEQQAQFEQLLQQQLDPSSPNFHHWLTPEQIGAQFGASAHDIDAVSAWLQAQGLHVDEISNSRLLIRFSGSAGTIATAFATELHRYAVNGEERLANTAAPSVPVALAPTIASIRGLRTVRRHSDLRQRAAQHDAAVAGRTPEGTNCQGSSCEYIIFPADFATIYGITPVTQQGITGSGQTIAIVGRARVSLPDIAAFENIANLASNVPTITVAAGGIDPGAAQTTCTDTSDCNKPSDQSEATLDVERAIGVAPGAKINLVISANSSTDDGSDIATEYVIDHSPLLANILSISFGSCETDVQSDGVSYLDGIYGQAAAEGISVFVASGDEGAAGCDNDDDSTTPPASQYRSANALCSSSHVTCVGGTEFADSSNPASYWRSSDTVGYESALGYIPEGAWNEPLDQSGALQVAASGGGVSLYIPTPSWQTGPGVPGTQGRYTPDVSFSAASHDGYFTCMAASNGSCVVANGSFNLIIASGTSASTPSMAGIAALLNQQIGSAQGNLNPRLYALAATPSNAVFHDVTVSSSGVSGCTVTTPSLCNNSTPGPTSLGGGLAGYLVGTGYDEATGLGSLNVQNLLAQWQGGQTQGPTATPAQLAAKRQCRSLKHC